MTIFRCHRLCFVWVSALREGCILFCLVRCGRICNLEAKIDFKYEAGKASIHPGAILLFHSESQHIDYPNPYTITQT